MPNSGRFVSGSKRTTFRDRQSVQFFTRASPHRGRVLVVGDVMVDRCLWSDCHRLSPEAPVPVARVRNETLCLGGAANVAASVVALGGEVQLASVTGASGSVGELLELLDQTPIDTAGLVFEDGRRLTRKNRVVAERQQLLRYDEEDDHPATATSQAQLLSIAESGLVGAGSLILSDYGKGTLPVDLVKSLIESARANGVPVLVDPNGADWEKYRGATVVTPNRRQLALATGIDPRDEASAQRAGRQVIERFGIEHCLITLSEDGAALVGGDSFEYLPAEARTVREVTGAGDTFVAVLGLAIARGLQLVDACRIANVAAGVVVEKVGTATLTPAELERALALSHETKAREPLVDLQTLLAVREELKRLGRKLVFTNGCFDILHVGHVRCLEQAASFGDVLVVGLNSDESVKRLKGATRPINGLAERGYVLDALSFVDYVVAFSEDTPLRLIEQLRPDVLVKGSDYPADEIVGASLVRGSGGHVETVPLVPKLSTTRVADILELERSCSS